MKKLKIVLALVGCLVLFFILFSIFSKGQYWNLSIINSGNEPAEISVALADGKWTIAPGESKTIKIEKQKVEDREKEREFTITVGGKSETLKSIIGKGAYYEDDLGTVLIDVTGTNCATVVDFGPLYAEEETPIKLINIYKGQKIYYLEEFLNVKLGEKLPETITISKGVTVPVLHSLVKVPCEIISDTKKLSEYLLNL